MLGGLVRDKDNEIGTFAIKQIYKALKNNGAFICCENGYATSIHQFFRNRYGAGKNKWKYFTIDELTKTLEIFDHSEFISFGLLGCFGKNEWLRNIFSMIDIILETVFPSNSRYIHSCLSKKTTTSIEH